MFGRRKRVRSTTVDTLVGRRSELFGDLRFTGGLHVDGTVKGNVVADEGTESFLNLSEHGTIEGEVRVPNVILDGTVIGDVYARSHIELASNARVSGNVYYALIEMAMGAEVNGNLVRWSEDGEPEPGLAAGDPELRFGSGS
ncbi:MAG: polymer-forming cytoskeletal protein [Ectothiorhodospiraceae bacterium]|nr:polymer-forming cytoskeletal protein [Chromatiales bacterium]MCP5153491.1 polymer-forming cytoskeletal protein [Ectothiorhodospiraceae bacterium]